MDLTNKTLFITGIGNFVGLQATKMAMERGMKVRGIESSPEAAKQAESLGATVFVGNTTDVAALEKGCESADIVFHTESVIEENGDLEFFRKINVGGTINTAKAAKQAGVKTFIHLSSVLVYGFKYPDQVTENGTLKGENNPFCQTKIESETALLACNDPPSFGVIIIRAGDVYGPGATTWVARPLTLMQKQKFVLINGGQGIINHAYVDNLVDGVFLAIEKETYGEAFNITDGHQTTWKEYYTRLAEIGGMPKPISMPAFLVKSAAQFQAAESGVSPAAIDFVTRLHTYSIEKARRILGYEPQIGLEEGMSRTAEWLNNSSILT
jgi:nucleoside-diphosphate-sugar epimerase